MTMPRTNPCKGCKYYNICGSYSRKEPCDGRVSKRSNDGIGKTK